MSRRLDKAKAAGGSALYPFLERRSPDFVNVDVILVVVETGLPTPDRTAIRDDPSAFGQFAFELFFQFVGRRLGQVKGDDGGKGEVDVEKIGQADGSQVSPGACPKSQAAVSPAERIDLDADDTDPVSPDGFQQNAAVAGP